LRVDQTSGDTYTVVVNTHAAFDNRTNTQIAAHRVKVHFASAIPERRGARDDRQVTVARQRHDHFFSDALAKMRRGVTDRRERQHGK
jgi:hypothetical protein